MKKFKHLLSIMLVVICITTSTLIPANAATYSKAKLVNYLTSQFESYSTEIDISSFRIPRAKYNEIYNLIETDIPTIFCTSKYTIYSQNDMCKYIKATYIDKSEYNALLKRFNKNTDYLLRDIKTNNLSDEDKILLVHDRLIAWCEYDYDNFNSVSIPKNSARAFGAIVNKSAVCAGYTRAFVYLMKKLGIDCEYINSSSLDHAWNIVTLNGKRYHIDTTWDDTRCVGEVEHDNLLRSTKGIISTNHNASDFDSSPYDTAYDDYYWQRSDAEIHYYNNSFYYIDKATGNIIKRSNNTETVIATVDSKWIYAQTGGVYRNCYSKLCSDDDYLYFTTPDAVYSIDSSGNIRKVYSPNIPHDLSIYGFSVNDGRFNIYCYETPNIGESNQSSRKITYQYKEVNYSNEDINTTPVTDSPSENSRSYESHLAETTAVSSNIFFDLLQLFQLTLNILISILNYL